MMYKKIGFLFIILLMAALNIFAAKITYDSLGTTRKAGQLFIIHQVEEGETLFSLSRRYGASVALISQENPEVENGLKIGQKILIPFKEQQTSKKEGIIHKVAPSETLYSISRQYNVSTDQIRKWNKLSDNSISIGQELIIKEVGNVSKTEPGEKINYTGRATHTVEASETLYSISKKYSVSIEEMKKWNNLESNELSIGQVLIVSFGNTAANNSSMLPANLEEKKPDKEKDNAETSINVTEIKTPEVVVGPTNSESQTIDSKKIVEEGFAQVIEGRNETKKYLALHKTAPIGTIMQVRNKMNNQTVFVRVVGVLPNTGENNKILLKISKKAFDRLGAVDAKFPVEISYIP